MNCTLCLSLDTKIFHEKYFSCQTCGLIFISPLFRLDTFSEFERYMKHENNVEESGYQKFVQPLVDKVMQTLPIGSLGLDFGSGPDSAVGHLLRQNNYQVKRYDPYFHPDTQVLEEKYDFVVAYEVVEHFYHPSNSFETMKKLVRPKGWLFLMTALYDETIDFSNWSYRRDSTHVSFYTRKTLDWIKNRFSFRALTIQGQNLAMFENN